jgi:hypothetical protein
MTAFLNFSARYTVRSQATLAFTDRRETVIFPANEALIAGLNFSPLERNLADSLLAWSYDFNEMKITGGVMRERERERERDSGRIHFLSLAKTGCGCSYLPNVAEQ